MGQIGYSAKKITMGGIITTISLVVLYLSSLFPTNRISLLALSSMFVFVLVIEFNIRTAVISYMATSLLGLILLPDKLMTIAYIIYFGYYGIIKSLIERINNIALEWIVKISSFNIAIFILYLIIGKFFPQNLQVNTSLWLIIVFLQTVFIAYDILYSFIIMFYNKKTS